MYSKCHSWKPFCILLQIYSILTLLSIIHFFVLDLLTSGSKHGIVYLHSQYSAPNFNYKQGLKPIQFCQIVVGPSMLQESVHTKAELVIIYSTVQSGKQCNVIFIVHITSTYLHSHYIQGRVILMVVLYFFGVILVLLQKME